MKNTIQDKTKLVNSVFSKVYKKYDLMNDIMSFGIHRVWKQKFINWMNPGVNSKLIDVASGTGDIAKLFSKKNNNLSEITCIEPNKEMLERGKKNLLKFKNISWMKAKAENLPIKDNSYDYYSISYGIRNVTDINKVLKEAYRVLKPGGRFMCLEFSKIDNELINFFYKKYSMAIPLIGKYVVGTPEPYEYLIKSIEKFYTQKQLIELMNKNCFSNTEYRNLSNGISAIHSGWKI
ncbi:bifunctional demethylmenaquinone methyltransferase/2-methoxy-6-polyprenyl-1,4-benzoquinol methylase UbiE [Pelagibacteraceae bacterium]|jgi:demethylmenaquinone methyltransferase / 2-methoxy-6-polyprenyl-1,4-benzoquinol methylase|nr:bifunctional demethylmenaquinone methyltransferase/2-methoxy-6-polyprenyl-1,4-benzoquinol methylase UbiE [Pelagibacteraceae bacterium]MDC0952174.1 bifunctional demethylmenaquinone methyltransferase/2-methoxy-6-polyprenyl-1,4-benzoquinol methylase UbiE [Pelagibacteraceae bacterium]